MSLNETDKIMQWFTAATAGVHFTPDVAEQLKKHIDRLTDRSASCPCSNCRKS